ncbi:hypothetical protein COL922a_007175 [Colletotrichum nupharicola]|nr:hypothetical protein COL922a_007175 [Colletotrichum nupharicola]
MLHAVKGHQRHLIRDSDIESKHQTASRSNQVDILYSSRDTGWKRQSMRLINVQTGRLEEFFHEPPPYAVLSHTWGSDEEEISFRDIQEGNEVFKTGIGRDKFAGFCEQALADELDYAWMDTCCIDKTNSTELSEAINSMFTWYQKADVCYAFLADVSSIDDPSNAESQFRRSRWFERGWTLQELLAPSRVRFYNRDWSLLGTKRQLSTVVAQTTGIPRPFLLGTANLREASVAQRMSWAANRVTKRKEDIAYCLLGIFGVNLPMIYGEGDQAFARLQEEIMRRNTDDSILAWNLNSTESAYDDKATVGGLSGSILAASPFDFASSGDIVCRERRGTSIDPLYVFGGHLRIRLRLYKTAENQIFGFLDCHAKDNVQSVVGIPLLRIRSDGSYDEYVRPEGQQGRLLDVTHTEAPPQLIHICRNGQNQSETSTSRRYGFYVEESVHETGLEMFDVEPRDRWEKDNATINTTVDFGLDQVQRTWIRFRDTSLHIIASKIFETNPHTFGKQSASNGVSNLQVSLDEERVGACQMFVVRLASMSNPPRVNVDVSLELAQLERQVYLSDLLYEDRAIGPERANLSRLAWEKAAIVEKHKTKIAAIQWKLDRLQLEKKTLNAGLSALVRDIDQLHMKDQTLKERRSALSEAVTHAQDVLVRLDKESISQWYGLMVGSLVKSTLPVESKSGSSIANESKRLLLQAVLEGHEATVQFLLDRGSKVESTDDEGRSLLRIATSRGHEGLMKMLVERGADTESVNQHGITPLLEATFQGNASAAGLLLDVKAQINARDKNGQSPLSIAALKGHLDVARLLLDMRSDIRSKDKDGRDPLHVAVANEHKDFVDLLLLEGADIETATKSGQTPLSLSSMLGKEAMTRHLLGNGASVHARDANGWTPLFHATLKGHDEIMKLLIQNGADINAKDTKEQSLLHVAIENGQKSAETILVERGATA